jgi:outer membrane protein
MWKIAALVLVLFPAVVFAQGRVAVVNLEEAILQTDYAQAQLELIESDEEFKSNKAEFDQLQADLQKIAEDFQRDSAAMSEEQKAAVRQKVASKQSDIEYVGKKLQAMQQQGAQQILQELVPQAREVLRDIIATDQIGLLLQQQSVIHADMSYSITAKVTDKLNQLKAK